MSIVQMGNMLSLWSEVIWKWILDVARWCFTRWMFRSQKDTWDKVILSFNGCLDDGAPFLSPSGKRQRVQVTTCGRCKPKNYPINTLESSNIKTQNGWNWWFPKGISFSVTENKYTMVNIHSFEPVVHYSFQLLVVSWSCSKFPIARQLVWLELTRVLVLLENVVASPWRTFVLESSC